MRPARNAATASSFAAFRMHGLGPPASPRGRASARQGKVSRSGGSKSSAERAVEVEARRGARGALGIGRGRTGSGCACRGGRRGRAGRRRGSSTSAVDDRLRVDDDLDAVVAAGRTGQCASITSRPLFISVAESTVILAPIAHVGCASASVDGDPGQLLARRPRNGPPEAVKTMPPSAPAAARPRHCMERASARSRPGAAAAAARAAPRAPAGRRRRGSPCSPARGRRPHSSVARLASSPAAPTMALSTMSAPAARTSSTAARGTCVDVARRSPCAHAPQRPRRAARCARRRARERPAGAARPASPAASATTCRPGWRGRDVEGLGADGARRPEDRYALHRLSS